MPTFNMRNNSVAVPTEFIETHMVKANGSYVKVYLYAVYLAQMGEAMEQADIAAALNLLESDVKNALDYWKNEGLIAISADSVTIITDNGSNTSNKPKKTPAQIAKIMNENEQLSELCILAQDILAKPISPRDMETLYWIYDELGFAADAILMVLEYCVSKDKRSVQYAEKVAITWSERGINTIEKIDAYINEEKQRNNYFYSLRRLFGIADRPLSRKEEEYLRRWNEEFKMSEDMVALAYEYCIMQTNKLSFPYMDTILSNWHAKEIFSVDAAEAEHNKFHGSNSEKSFDVYRDSVDHSELERLMHEKFDS